MDKIAKALAKLSTKDRQRIKKLLLELEKSPRPIKLDFKKLKGYHNIFRLRRGNLRVIYQISDDGVVSLLAIERRADTTYNL